MPVYTINLKEIIDAVRNDSLFNFHARPDDLCTYEVVVSVLGSPHAVIDLYIPDTRGFNVRDVSIGTEFIEYDITNYKGDNYILYGDFYTYTGNPKAKDDVRAYFNTYHHLYKRHFKDFKNNGAYRKILEYRIDYKIIECVEGEENDVEQPGA